MAHTIHHIHAIVLRSTVLGEQSATVSLLTSDNIVISVRSESGFSSKKISPALCVGSVGGFDVIRTTHAWKLVGVSNTVNAILATSSSQSMAHMLAIIQYTYRYCSAGESETPGLYNLLYRALATVYKVQTNTLYDSYRLQLLQLLGYIDVDSVPITRKQLLQLIARAEENAHL